MRKAANSFRSRIGVYTPAVLLVLIGFVIAYQFIQPAPPSVVRLATGDPEGGYHHSGLAYQEFFKRQGIELKLVNTAGSMDNLELVRNGEVDVAFTQGGTKEQLETDDLFALGSLYFEPVWVFHRAELDVKRFPGLKGLRIAAGKPGSGTHMLVSRLLQDNGLNPAVLTEVDYGFGETVELLEQGKLDAAVLVLGANSPLINQLLSNPLIRLASMDRAGAYAHRYRFLHKLLLPEGSMNLQHNIPESDKQLIATTANLVANPDIHPAIVSLLLQAADRSHRLGGWFEEKNEFPSELYQEYPLHDDAVRYFKHGPPFLQRFLPFWAASLIDRIKIMLLPLVVLLLPFFKIMPPLYQWQMNRKVYRWYDELEVIDKQLDSSDIEESQVLLDRLHELDDDVRDIKVPVSFSSKIYELRLHIDLVRARHRE
ncbi:MAG: TAXI family TRAP transporter solute-binding subunit [bacterium]